MLRQLLKTLSFLFLSLQIDLLFFLLLLFFHSYNMQSGAHTDQDQWSNIIVHHRNRWIYDQSRFISSFEAPSSEWSWRTDPDPDHLKGTYISTDCKITFKNSHNLRWPSTSSDPNNSTLIRYGWLNRCITFHTLLSKRRERWSFEELIFAFTGSDTSFHHHGRFNRRYRCLQCRVWTVCYWLDWKYVLLQDAVQRHRKRNPTCRRGKPRLDWEDLKSNFVI